MDVITSSDIYKISDFVDTIQKKYMPVDEDSTLMMGTYGYLNDVFSNQIQNAVISAAENGNEAFPIRSKFEKSILTYAVTYNVDDINATPAVMEVMIGFVKRELDANLDKNGKFYLDKDISINIEGIEFHLDYELVIKKMEVSGGGEIYTAQYNMDRVNPASNISNPYLAPPIFLNMEGDQFIFITCKIRQVSTKIIYKKILSTNIFDNKTIDFEFENQIVCFEVKVTENGIVTYLTPVFEGMPLDNITNYCYYYYLDINTIRVKFNRDSYEPKTNADVEIILQTTTGADGNFKYNKNIIQSLVSKKYSYNGLSALIRPITDSVDGINRKTKDELSTIIPKEILARGTIINNKDIENFFNAIDNSKLYFYKRRDNQRERLYYSYMIVKDDDANIIPTNTLNLSLSYNDFSLQSDGRLFINPGSLINYNGALGSIEHKTPDTTLSSIKKRENTEFLYSTPFNIVVNKSPLAVFYYNTNINKSSQFKFTFINDNVDTQFISTKLNCMKNYIDTTNSNKYVLSMNLVQNINIEKNLVEYDQDTNLILKSKIKPVLVIDTDYGKYYTHGKMITYNKNTFSYTIKFALDTNNIIDSNSRITIKDLFKAGTLDTYDVQIGSSAKMSVYIFIEGETGGRGDADEVIPGMGGCALSNKYETDTDIVLFENYTDVINSSVVTVKGKGTERFLIKGVPLVKYSYLNDYDKYYEFMDYIQYRKAYMDAALEEIENSFTIDFKFFNTYGPSKMFLIGHDGEELDKVNIKIKFRVKILTNVDRSVLVQIKDSIKEYIENINNNISDIHMTNLTTHITNEYSSSIQYIEFVGINDYDGTKQYIQKLELTNIDDVPEFLNTNITNGEPDIELILV